MWHREYWDQVLSRGSDGFLLSFRELHYLILISGLIPQYCDKPLVLNVSTSFYLIALIMQKGPSVQINKELNFLRTAHIHTNESNWSRGQANSRPLTLRVVNTETSWGLSTTFSVNMKQKIVYYVRVEFTAGLIQQLHRSPFWEQILHSETMSRIHNRWLQSPLYWRNVTTSSAQTSFLQNWYTELESQPQTVQTGQEACAAISRNYLQKFSYN